MGLWLIYLFHCLALGLSTHCRHAWLSNISDKACHNSVIYIATLTSSLEPPAKLPRSYTGHCHHWTTYVNTTIGSQYKLSNLWQPLCALKKWKDLWVKECDNLLLRIMSSLCLNFRSSFSMLSYNTLPISVHVDNFLLPVVNGKQLFQGSWKFQWIRIKFSNCHIP